MAFIRRVRTPSGATGVQIAEYVGGGGQRIVAYVGSAHTPAELGVVMARARQLLAEYERPGQDSLDLGMDLEPVPSLSGCQPRSLRGLLAAVVRIARGAARRMLRDALPAGAQPLSQFLRRGEGGRLRGISHLRGRIAVSLCHNSKWRASPH